MTFDRRCRRSHGWWRCVALGILKVDSLPAWIQMVLAFFAVENRPMTLLPVQQLLSEATSFLAKFQQGSESVYINKNMAIALGREALALRPLGHPNRPTTLSNLALQQLGETDHLDEAIELEGDALVLRPPGHPDRSTSLSNLAFHLAARFNNLNEAVALARDALALRPPGHTDRLTSLSNLALYLSFFISGDEPVVLERNALALTSCAEESMTSMRPLLSAEKDSCFVRRDTQIGRCVWLPSLLISPLGTRSSEELMTSARLSYSDLKDAIVLERNA